ncbi:MAG: HD domain-containing protein [Lachnospiraceae bacterium]|nr:HD domain-containing protein [Lachnospiraceae bacterium]
MRPAIYIPDRLRRDMETAGGMDLNIGGMPVADAAEIQERYDKLLDILGAIVESRSLDGGSHIERIKNFTRALATEVMVSYPEYGLNPYVVEVFVAASALHDIGKITIPDSILFKPARLTREEFEYMKTHTTKGCEILNNIGNALSPDCKKASYEICRHHHEKYDGKGYPDGLRGDAIPISAQIVSVADVYDALVCERVYKDAFTKEQAFNMIISGECGMFNPKLMDCFRKCAGEFERLADEYRQKRGEI